MGWGGGEAKHKSISQNKKDKKKKNSIHIRVAIESSTSVKADSIVSNISFSRLKTYECNTSNIGRKVRANQQKKGVGEIKCENR